MSENKIRLNRPKLTIFFVLCILALIAVGSRALYMERQKDIRMWDRTKSAFESCSFDSVLYQIGYRRSTAQDLYPDPFRNIDANDAFSLALKQVATDKTLDLDAVQLDARRENISIAHPGGDGVQLLSICKRLMKEGNKEVALDIGRFYIITQKSQATSWLEAAAKNGMPAAYRLLGIAHQKGMFDSIKDEKKAFEYFMKAANAGDRLAKLYVSDMYRSIDPVSANLFLAAAAEQGSLTAAYRLQQSLRDPNKQYFWSLVFHFIRESELKKGFPQMDIEDESMYRWEGFPDIVGTNEMLGVRNFKREIIFNYDNDLAKNTLDRLEKVLPLPNRTAVQELFQRWVKEKYKKETIKPTHPENSNLMI